MTKLLVSIPVECDGFVNVHLASWLQNLRGKFDGVRITVRYIQSKPVAETRNLQCHDLLGTDNDYGLFIDADAMPDDEGLALLLEAIRRDDVDAVGGWSVMATPDGPVPCVQKYREAAPAVPNEGILSRPVGLHRIRDGGIGAHCLMVKRSTLEYIRKCGVPWFKDRIWDGSLEPFDLRAMLDTMDDAGLRKALEAHLAENRDNDRWGRRWQGQDVWFCLMCLNHGLKLWVDTRVFWGHVKHQDMRAEFLRVLALKQRLVAAGVPEAEVEAA